MNHKDQALRTAAKAFLCLHHGGTMTADEFKIFADLCCLALPMKYRFSRAELEEIEHNVKLYEPGAAAVPMRTVQK